MPYALSIGISYDEFWKMNPRIIKAYAKGYKMKTDKEIEMQNYMAYIQGQYVCEALLSTVCNMLGGKKSKNFKYPDKPYDFHPEEKKEMSKEEKLKRAELFLTQFDTMGRNFLLEKERKEN